MTEWRLHPDGYLARCGDCVVGPLPDPQAVIQRLDMCVTSARLARQLAAVPDRVMTEAARHRMQERIRASRVIQEERERKWQEAVPTPDPRTPDPRTR